nr:PH domain-containing protein [uncultured Kingella sp.]
MMYAAHWWETAVWNKADELAQALDAAQERRLHPSSFLFLAGAQAWAVLVGFLLPTAINMALDGSLKKILKVDAAGTRRVLKVMLPFLGIFGLLPLVGMLHFLSYRFSIRGNDIVIRSGILVKQTRHIPLDKIHNVTLRRNLLHRILGVAEVRLESGGTGEQSEALLRVLSLADAQACIRILQPDGAAFRQPEHDVMPSENLLPLGWRERVRYGVIGGTGLGLGGAAGVLFFQVFDGKAWLAAHLPYWTDAFSGNRIGGYTVFYTAAGLLVSALFGKLSAALAAQINWGNFTLSFADGRITQTRGRLTQIRSSLPAERIQAWHIVQSPTARLFGRHSVLIDTVMRPDRNETAVRTLLPVTDAQTVRRLVRLIGGADTEPQWQPVHPKAWRRYFVRYQIRLALCLAAALLLLGLMARLPENTAFAAAACWLAALPATLAAAAACARNSAWALDAEGFLHWKSGAIVRRHSIARAADIQSLSLLHSPFDRRNGMNDLLADTRGANPPIRLRYLDENSAKQLAARLRSSLETDSGK